MKIVCDKCGKDISITTNSMFEQYSVGKAKCPHCNAVQKRYISEADILLYFAVNETFYAIASIVTMFVFHFVGLSFWVILPIALILSIYFFFAKWLSKKIYINAPKKSKVKYNVFDEDAVQIKKNFRWQFMLFFALAITFVTMQDSLTVIVFFFIMIIAIAINYLKFFLQAKNERNSIN